MSLKHLFAGIMGGGFALILGVDPLTVSPGAVSPGFVEADKVIAQAEETKLPECSAPDRADDARRVVEHSKESAQLEPVDKPVTPETGWSHRLVFPSGNKF